MAINRNETIKIKDSKGFNYYVEIKYQPQNGLAFAYYNGRPIADVQYGRIIHPLGDDDAEWEVYEELFAEYKDRSKIDLQQKCKEYFDSKLK